MMRRRTLDALLTTGGAVMTVILLVAAVLLFWAGSFAKSSVSQQLSDQRITMPAGPAIDNPLIKPYLQQYAGQELSTGAQAKAYADHYILVHMNEAGGGQTYEEASAAYMTMAKDPSADPAAVKTAGDLRQTLFMGNTLRGLLLNAYAFGTMATIAIWAAIASVVGAVAMLLLTALGYRHLRRVPDDQEVQLGSGTPAPALR